MKTDLKSLKQWRVGSIGRHVILEIETSEPPGKTRATGPIREMFALPAEDALKIAATIQKTATRILKSSPPKKS